ncbi:MAG: hypothetical protein KDJ45_06295 [Hyphomicrobiaceae bacterium]|nr:hypothetical protein [Hyphomicrobiaceae bacterium]MCC0009289.1 hypothetical protein [Hyphomicrobiaceae bacterium]
MIPEYINPLQWHEALGVARQSCARVFRDGGAPSDALEAFGIQKRNKADDELSWDRAVTMVAQAICATPMHRAA